MNREELITLARGRRGSILQNVVLDIVTEVIQSAKVGMVQYTKESWTIPMTDLTRESIQRQLLRKFPGVSVYFLRYKLEPEEQDRLIIDWS